MKNILKNILGTGTLLVAISLFSNVNAQSNTIQEIKLTNNDGFNELRNLVINNFDFNNPNFTEGIINSEINFSIADNGKITNVIAKGDCKYVSEELTNVMTHLLYKVDKNKLKENMIASNYVMPVTVKISGK